MGRELEGKLALVTGAGSGIGRAVANRLAWAGAGVVLSGRDGAALETTAADIRSRGGRAHPCPGDITVDEDRNRLVAAVGEVGGGLHALVHSAGCYAAGRIAELDPRRLAAMWAVNAVAPVVLSRDLLPQLLREPGDVVFMNSSIVRRSAGGVGGYAATKQALRAFADAFREEVNPGGVRVLSVFAGRTATRMQESIFVGEGRPYRPERLLQPEDVARIVVTAICLPRSAELTDIDIRPNHKP